MTAKERYRFLRHSERLLSWQIEQAEKELRALNAQRRDKLRAIRQAHRSFKLGIGLVRAANVAYYNRVVFNSGRF